jgi:biopolymer transport protein ExbD
MERQHQKSKTPALNLVSLMDIFTILVFFLLVNSSSTQQLPSNKDLKLPSSVSQNVPEDTLTIAVTTRDILIQGVSVAKVEQALAAPEATIEGLKAELLFLSGQDANGAASDPAQRSIMIMGDENISYALIRKILTTCQEANYTQIAFAATQKAKSKI